MTELCANSIAELQHDKGPSYDAADLQEAREHLKERLHEGKTINRLCLRDLIDSDICGPRAEFAMIEIVSLLLADSDERAAKADTYVEGVIERFLETNDDLVEEAAAELALEESWE